MKDKNIDEVFGLANTRKRLELIFGEMAGLEIRNENKNTVLTTIVLFSQNGAMAELDK